MQGAVSRGCEQSFANARGAAQDIRGRRADRQRPRGRPASTPARSATSPRSARISGLGIARVACRQASAERPARDALPTVARPDMMAARADRHRRPQLHDFGIGTYIRNSAAATGADGLARPSS
jgi:hypothetical protein